MGYPTASEEIEILNRMEAHHPIHEVESVMTQEEVVAHQEKARAVFVEKSIKKYIVDIVTKSRSHHEVYLGVSPRGSLALLKAGQALAMIYGRDFVLPDDIKYLAPFVLEHRIILKPDARYSGTQTSDVIEDILKKTAVPINKRDRF
jgi:MoxR-like ATPase